jgi:hypothetical protein
MMEKKHDTKIIREYLNEMREIENVDFHSEIKLAEKKF